MPVPAELSSLLPETLDSARIRAAVRGPGSPGGFGGETWIIDLDGALAVLTRRSVFDPLEVVPLAVEAPVTQRDSEVEIHPAEGEAFVVRPSFFDVEAVTKLLAGVEGLATAPPPSSANEERVGVEVVPAAQATDEDQEFEQAGQVAALVSRGADTEALALARRRLAQTAGDEARRWRDLIRVLELLHAGEQVDALWWARASEELDYPISDAVYLRLAAALDQADEPLLAWAALEELLDEHSGAALRARLDDRLPDEASRAGELEQRARDRFSGLAQDGDPFAQRALGQALLRLDQLEPALMWIRRAKHGDPRDAFTRELELDILQLQAIEAEHDHDDGDLLAAIDRFIADFPESPRPWLALADHYEYDDANRAIEALREALRREFSALALRDLAELLASSKRHGELIRTIEDAFADHAEELEEFDFVAEELRTKLAASRAALAVAPSTPLVATSAVAPKFAVFVVALLVLIGLAAVLLL